MLWGAVTELGKLTITGVVDYFKGKMAIRQAMTENRIRLALSEQSHNQEWEMRSLENAGWKDDILFYSVLYLFVWSAIDPEGARRVFENWKVIPQWLLEITGWLVASVLGVRKIGEYLPGMISGVKMAWTSRSESMVERGFNEAKEVLRPVTEKPSDVGRVFTEPENVTTDPKLP